MRKANTLYVLAAEICTHLTHRQVPWTLENPRNSLFWWVPAVDDLQHLQGVQDTVFQHCMHGGHRDKHTRLRCWPTGAFTTLYSMCDGQHEHKPWGAYGPGKFATADEAEFPDLLCQRIATQVLLAIDVRPRATCDAPTTAMIPTDVTPVVPSTVSPRPQVPTLCDVAAFVSADTTSSVHSAATPRPLVRAHARSAGVQPRGLASQPVMNEFRAVALLRVPREHLQTARNIVNTRPHSWLDTPLPKGTKVLSLVEPECGECGSDSDRSDSKEALSNTGEAQQGFLKVGIPWTPGEFVRQSLQCEHPFAKLELDDDLLRTVFRILTRSKEATRSARDQALAFWRNRATELESAELQLREQVHCDVRPSVSQKNVLLFRDLLTKVNFPNPERVAHAMAVGFPLSGDIQRTEVFPELHRPAEAHITDLWRTAQEAQADLQSTLGRSQDPELDEAVTSTTLEEVERGWLRGPFTPKQLDDRHGRWVAARRFGIRQGDSTRVIDDYSEFGQNSTVGTFEKIDTGGVDVLANLVRGVLSAVGNDCRDISLELSDGTYLEGELHEDWSEVDARTLLGKVWDLSKAYRQLARSPAHASISIVGVWNSRTSRVELYEQLVLPFGSTASVYDFNWIARALQKILVVEFDVLTIHYFDDFPTVDFEALHAHTQAVVDGVFKLLGWATKTQKPFAQQFDVLGVVCDLSASLQGLVRFKNKHGRVDELAAFISGIRSRGFIRRGEARTLRGRFQFARCQTFGRCGAVTMHMLGQISEGARGSPALTETLRESLEWLVRILRESRPRELHARAHKPLILFVDGACEGSTVTIGAVLFDAEKPDEGPLFFGATVGVELVELWSRDQKKQLIGQAEILPTLLARHTWPEIFRNRCNITFIDNDSARFSLVRGYSPVLDSGAMINECRLVDAQLATRSWYARVSTFSNLADGPSRLEFSEVRAFIGARQFEVAVPASWGVGNFWAVVARRLSQGPP